jgi:hypothetical protein
VIARTGIRSDTEIAATGANTSCFARKTNELRRASPDADALSPRAARFTKWIIFKHKNFSLIPDDAYGVRVRVQAMRDSSFARLYFAAAGAGLPTYRSCRSVREAMK